MLKKDIFIEHCFFSCLVFLSSNFMLSQTINFTIDSATDNGTSITESIVSGPDTYILTISHPGNEEVLDLGGGDKAFYHSAIDPLLPYSLSLTKNGNPTNFMLNGIDYDTVEAGVITVNNQDDDEIAAAKNYSVGAGAITITNTTNAADITGVKIIPSDADDLNDFAFHNISVDVLNTLTSNTIKKFNNNITVFPNPSNGIFTIRHNNTVLKSIYIYSSAGDIVFYQNFSEAIIKKKQFNINSILASGVYLIEIISKKERSIIKRIVIQ